MTTAYTGYWNGGLIKRPIAARPAPTCIECDRPLAAGRDRCGPHAERFDKRQAQLALKRQKDRERRRLKDQLPAWIHPALRTTCGLCGCLIALGENCPGCKARGDNDNHRAARALGLPDDLKTWCAEHAPWAYERTAA